MKQIQLMTVLDLILMVSALATAQAQDVITIDKGEIIIESDDGDKVITIDADGLEALISNSIGEALEGVQDVLAEMDEMQLEIRLGDDNQLTFETEDQMWEMNMNVLFKEIGSALETAFDEIDSESWSSHHIYSDDDYDEEELNELKEI